MGKIKILFLFLLPIIVSCTNSSIEEFVVGENFVNDQAAISKIDSLTLQTSIVKLDSIISHKPERFLVGSTYNTFTGYNNASSFLTMKFDGTIDNTKFVYDSLCLVLSYDKYFSGDTLVTQNISIHQLQEQMALANGVLYSSDQFKYDPVPLGTISFKPRPKSRQQLSIKLSDELGNRMAEMIKLKKDTITSSDLFIKYFFNGIVIKSEENVNGSIIGFRTSDKTPGQGELNKNMTKPEIRLYYHLSPNPNETKDLYYKFPFATDGVYFNRITEDISNSMIDGIGASKNEMNSKLLDNQLIIQAGNMIFSKIKIPYLDNLSKVYSNTAVVGAALNLYPVKGTYTKANELPDTLYVYTADKNNGLLGQVTVPGKVNEFVYAILAKNSNKQPITDEKDRIFYQANISSFVEAELAAQLETTNSLLIGFGSNKSKKETGRVVIGGINSGKYSPALSVFYYHN